MGFSFDGRAEVARQSSDAALIECVLEAFPAKVFFPVTSDRLLFALVRRLCASLVRGIELACVPALKAAELSIAMFQIVRPGAKNISAR